MSKHWKGKICLIICIIINFSWNKAIQLDPNDNIAWIGKGLALNDLGRNYEALDWLFYK